MKNISKEEDLFPILYPAFTKQLHVMHPSITGVAANEYPTIDEMGEYTNTHANRYDSKGEVDHLNETIRGKDFEMEQQLQQLMDELDDDSDDDTDDDTDDDSDDDCTKGTTKKDTARKMEATAMVSNSDIAGETYSTTTQMS